MAKAQKHSKPKPAPNDNTVREQCPTARAYVDQGDGTDEETAARCEAAVPGWDGLGAKSKAEVVKRMRSF